MSVAFQAADMPENRSCVLLGLVPSIQARPIDPLPSMTCRATADARDMAEDDVIEKMVTC
ncbi:hypothetical protein DEM27_06350 [Metarhizobium album]|uniref:Uncharacterized protein n=1 Tax=Metarhizobium album TaxID=2182425 RepID=A0A2U2DVC2_9HYPH|nr:hypothetical protein DEM27_06350 [Rhizobium album]